jgi:hypothetical protein
VTTRAFRTLALAGVLTALAVAAPARAYRFNDYLEVYGYTQVWTTAWEQMEDARGLYQYPSRDEASDALSGFSLAKARLGIRLVYPAWALSLHAQARMDHDFMLLDADTAWSPRPWFELHLGQFKVPGTYEALADDRQLDFILRTEISTALADYSLSKADDPNSLLYGSVSNLRDLGVAAKGSTGGDDLTLRYFFMVSNGLGAGMYFGGSTRKEYFITNKAEFYYGLRLELEATGLGTLGFFASYNRHDNIVFNSGRAVYDLDRRMIGGDLRVAIPAVGLRLGLLGGGGLIRDDFIGDGKTDLRYLGFAASAVWDTAILLEPWLGWTLPEGHRLELAIRFDRFDKEVDQSGLVVRRFRTTLGANYVASTWVKLQVNYVLRHTDDPTAVAGDLANNILFANFQAAF